jgi:hypothetical protein
VNATGCPYDDLLSNDKCGSAVLMLDGRLMTRACISAVSFLQTDFLSNCDVPVRVRSVVLL